MEYVIPIDSSLEIIDYPDPEDRLRDIALRQTLESILAQLAIQQQQALVLRFGLGDDAALSIEEVGQEMGISTENAKRLIESGLRNMRHPLTRLLVNLL